jgi:hypothetical protein
VGEFALGADHAPVVSDHDVGIEALLVVDDDRVIDGADVDLGVLRDDQAEVDSGVALAIASLRRNGHRTSRDGGRERGLADMAESIFHRVFPHLTPPRNELAKTSARPVRPASCDRPHNGAATAALNRQPEECSIDLAQEKSPVAKMPRIDFRRRLACRAAE